MRLGSGQYSTDYGNSLEGTEEVALKSTSPELPNHKEVMKNCGPNLNNDELLHILRVPESAAPLAPTRFVTGPMALLMDTMSSPQGVKRRQSQSLPFLIADTPQNSHSNHMKHETSLIRTLPSKYEFCPVEDMVILISNMIEELTHTNDNPSLRSCILTRFHSRAPPGISVLEYLKRLAKHATLTPPLLLSMVYYMDKLCSLYPDFTVNSLTVHRFLITACTVASKGLCDAFWNNATYARVGGIKFAELGLLELDFLYRLDWKIIPKPETLTDYYQGLVAYTPGYQIEFQEISINDEDLHDSMDSQNS